MSNARNLANLLGTGTQITTADIADGAFQANKNLIINGAMQVAQRGTSQTGVTSSGYASAPDRFSSLIMGWGLGRLVRVRMHQMAFLVLINGNAQ